MIFTVEEINLDPALLPNITLGYLVASTCLAEGTTLSAALALVTGQEETVSGAECNGALVAPVIISDTCSSASIVVADSLGVFDILMVKLSVLYFTDGISFALIYYIIFEKKIQ